MVTSMLPDEQETGHKVSPSVEKKRIDQGGVRRKTDDSVRERQRPEPTPEKPRERGDDKKNR
jgi:hypothetical protein